MFPQFFILLPFFFTPHKVCKSALCAENGPPIGMLTFLLHN